MRYYAVKVGLVPGIYTSWDECKPNVNGFPGAKFKSFDTLPEAEAYLKDDTGAVSSVSEEDFGPYDAIVYTDGSYNPSTGVSGYGLVMLIKDSTVQKYAKITDSGVQNDAQACLMRNVAGEILAVEAALQIAHRRGIKSLLIRHDYIGISEWATGRWNANNPYTMAYRDIARKFALSAERIGQIVQAVLKRFKVKYPNLLRKLYNG
jgi:ribonuclease HI